MYSTAKQLSRSGDPLLGAIAVQYEATNARRRIGYKKAKTALTELKVGKRRAAWSTLTSAALFHSRALNWNFQVSNEMLLAIEDTMGPRMVKMVLHRHRRMRTGFTPSVPMYIYDYIHHQRVHDKVAIQVWNKYRRTKDMSEAIVLLITATNQTAATGYRWWHAVSQTK
jgi:hypothetical protein